MKMKMKKKMTKTKNNVLKQCEQSCVMDYKGDKNQKENFYISYPSKKISNKDMKR